jgi:uncharacterized membrane protein
MDLWKRVQLVVIVILGAYLLYAGLRLQPQYDAALRPTTDASADERQGQ